MLHNKSIELYYSCTNVQGTDGVQHVPAWGPLRHQAVASQYHGAGRDMSLHSQTKLRYCFCFTLNFKLYRILQGYAYFKSKKLGHW